MAGASKLKGGKPIGRQKEAWKRNKLRYRQENRLGKNKTKRVLKSSGIAEARKYASTHNVSNSYFQSLKHLWWGVEPE